MAKKTEDEDAANKEDAAPITHPEEIRLEATLTISGKPTARAAIRATPAGVICAGLAVGAIILAVGGLARMIRPA
jgi:hypothetical protein